MPIIGTAGHVDHGKSTLVQAITGRDPDRWTEEKERGLTIDLGFAWTELDGVDVGFVDVPGHERFIKNMLAGVGAIDCALLVIAADSGWMPQTEEHAAVLDLLDTGVGVIALTRIDLVDKDTVELAALEIMDEIEGTSLQGWPVVPVSAITGEGMESLVEHLASAVGQVEQHGGGPLRMWVDRSFTISGAGVVVTGTIARGEVTTGDDVEILPSGQSDRVRGIHHHDRGVDRSVAGSRTAINLQGAKLAAVSRGNLICTPGSIDVSTRILARLEPARRFEEIPPRGAFHFHIGTAHSPATIRRLHDADTYVITLDAALPVAMGDRFILRDSGRQAVVGGGRVLDPMPQSRLTPVDVKTLKSAVDGSATEMADALLTVRRIARVVDLIKATGGGSPSTGLRAAGTVISETAANAMVDRSIDSYCAIPDAKQSLEVGGCSIRCPRADSHRLMSRLSNRQLMDRRQRWPMHCSRCVMSPGSWISSRRREEAPHRPDFVQPERSSRKLRRTPWSIARSASYLSTTMVTPCAQESRGRNSRPGSASSPTSSLRWSTIQ